MDKYEYFIYMAHNSSIATTIMVVIIIILVWNILIKIVITTFIM
jgi:hypothetical protein